MGQPNKIPTEQARERKRPPRWFRAIDSWWLDVKLGIRMLFKYPGLALVGGVGIAVAVAIATGGFSVIDRNFRPSSLSLDESDRIVSIEIWDSAASNVEPRILHELTPVISNPLRPLPVSDVIRRVTS